MVLIGRDGKEFQPGDSFIIRDGFKYTYLGGDDFKAEKIEIPFHVDPPTLREAVKYPDIEGLKTTKCCHSCSYFSPCMFSAPAGWCGKYVCKQVNTDEFSVCNDYTPRS